jgi:U3 small nucleolar RNA-associated protein 12
VGTKSGEILIYDIAASALTESISAHKGAVWSMQVRPDELGLVTGSADKDVKFWDFTNRGVDKVSPIQFNLRFNKFDSSCSLLKPYRLFTLGR